MQPPKATPITSATIVDTHAEVKRSARPAVPPETDIETTTAEDRPTNPQDVVRDAGVSDEVWEQLQQDRKTQEVRDNEHRRLKEEAEKASEAAREKIVQRLLEEERKRKEELEKQKKLASSGLCPMGYAWIKQSGGYRCASGSHWMSDVDVAKM